MTPTPTATRIYQLLPAIYRLRDEAQHQPLAELVAIIAEQVAAIEENLDQLYDDQFIETCAPWVAPYIGDLIGYRSLHGVVPRLASPRAEVANTVRLRRRKGTASMLEQLARDVTGWHARVVEFFQHLATTQYMNHLRLEAPATASLRDIVGLELSAGMGLSGGAFDALPHTVDVRRTSRGGRYNIPNIGIFLWRLDANRLTRTQAAPGGGVGTRFRINPLGFDTPLVTKPETETEITHLAEPINVPMPIGRRLMDAHLQDYYGPGKSLFIELAGANPTDPPEPVSVDDVHVCNLSDVVDTNGVVTGWAHAAPAGTVAIDPVFGRLVFGDAPAHDVLVTWHYGFGDDLGGGEYERGETLPVVTGASVIHRGDAIQPQLDAVQAGGVVEIVDSATYAETVSIAADANGTVTLRASNGARPLIVLGGDLELTGGPGSTIELNGLVIDGGRLHVPAGGGNALKRLRLTHCTLVPRIALNDDGLPLEAGSRSIVAELPELEIEIDHCILGGLRVMPDTSVLFRGAPDPTTGGYASSASIVDATGPDRVAIAGLDDVLEGGQVALEGCTVIGKIHATRIDASNCLLVARLADGDTWTAPVWIERRQDGCVRFTYVPFDAIVPRRFRCQPHGTDDPRMRPQFTSTRYGDAGYAQLGVATPREIRQGADDESEMGAFHDVHAPQREINLRVRLDEYLRVGLEAGIIYAS